MYKAVWTPTNGERLCVQREPRNAHDRRAVDVLTSEDTLVGHAPREISLVPRPRPAFRRLQYGKAWRAWYLFSREHDVIGKW